MAAKSILSSWVLLLGFLVANAAAQDEPAPAEEAPAMEPAQTEEEEAPAPSEEAPAPANEAPAPAEVVVEKKPLPPKAGAIVDAAFAEAEARDANTDARAMCSRVDQGAYLDEAELNMIVEKKGIVLQALISALEKGKVAWMDMEDGENDLDQPAIFDSAIRHHQNSLNEMTEALKDPEKYHPCDWV